MRGRTKIEDSPKHSEESSSSPKKRGSGGWIFGVIMMCAVMYLATMFVGQSQGSSSTQPNHSAKNTELIIMKESPIKDVQIPLISNPVDSIQSSFPDHDKQRISAFNAASMFLKKKREEIDKQHNTELVQQQTIITPKPMESLWVPPPSQANYGESNPRKLTRPKVAKQSDSFLKARKASWEKGRPVLTAPMPDEYIPHLTAPKRPMKSRDPYSLPKPLWDVPHVPTNDAILALAVNYRIIDYVRFVGTLRRTGYSGDIVLAVSAKMDDNSRKFLQSMDVIAYPVLFNCSNGKTGARESVKHSLECDWHQEQDVPLPLAIIRHELYLSWAWLYDKSSRLLILDFRDTFFQRDPFESLTLGTPAEPYFQQLLVLEHWPYKRMSNCPWNSGWVRGCFGNQNFKPMSNHPILCSGSYFATRDGMIDMEAELLNEVRSAKCHKKGVPSDQGYVNYLFWAKRLPYALGEVRGDGIVNTVGALMGKNHGGSIGPLGTWFKIISEDGFVMDNDNKTHSAVVHQWDRFFDELYFTVDAVLECDDCYTSKNGHGTYTCKCLKQGCQCREGTPKP